MRAVVPLRLALLATLLTVLAGCGSPAPTSLDVDGRVADGYGVGVPNISVAPLGRTPTVTATDGSFSFADVTIPYDLVAFDASDAWVHLFPDLREAQPTLVPGEAVFGGSILDASSATLNVTPDVAPGPGEVTVVCVENPSIPMMGCQSADDADPVSMLVDAGWFGPGSVTATVRGVLYAVDADGLATAAIRMGTVSVDVSDGANESLGLVLAPVDDVTVSLEVAVADGATLEGVGLALLLPDGRNALRVPFGSPAPGTVSVALPDLAGATVVALAQANGADGGAIAWSDPTPVGDPISLSVPAALEVLGPADAAVDVGLGASFAVEQRADLAYLFVVDPDVGGVGPDLMVTTLEAAIDLPDLTALDAAFDLPAAQPYEWRVFAFGPIGDAGARVRDAGASAEYLRLSRAAGNGYGPGPAAAGVLHQTRPRTFTTP